MIVVNKKLKYLFKYVPKKELLKNKIQIDKTIFKYFHYMNSKDSVFDKYGNIHSHDLKEVNKSLMDILFTNPADDEWELIHLDGDYKNCALDNLEPVVFVEEEPMEQLGYKIDLLNTKLRDKDEEIKKWKDDSQTKTYQIQNMQKQLLHEQNRVKELNKELRKQEKEIRRLFSIIEAKEK